MKRQFLQVNKTEVVEINKKQEVNYNDIDNVSQLILSSVPQTPIITNSTSDVLVDQLTIPEDFFKIGKIYEIVIGFRSGEDSTVNIGLNSTNNICLNVGLKSNSNYRVRRELIYYDESVHYVSSTTVSDIISAGGGLNINLNSIDMSISSTLNITMRSNAGDEVRYLYSLIRQIN